MEAVFWECVGGAGAIGRCIVFPPHLEQNPDDVDTLPLLVSEGVF
jgi:hypothetical protein